MKIFIKFLRNTTQFHLFSFQNMFFFHSSPRDCPSKTGCNTLSMLKSQLSLCGTGLNHRRLQQSMFLSKTWKNYFPGSKWIAGNTLCICCFFPIPENVFILCIGFFYRFREMFLRPKLSILYSMYLIGIKYILYYIILYYIILYYIILYLHTRFCTYLYNLKGKAF